MAMSIGALFESFPLLLLRMFSVDISETKRNACRAAAEFDFDSRIFIQSIKFGNLCKGQPQISGFSNLIFNSDLD